MGAYESGKEAGAASVDREGGREMIGGKVVEVIREPERIFLNVQDTTYKKDRCGIYVERNDDSEFIEAGDKVWWQGNQVFWTSESYLDLVEVPIPRASYSGVDHPLGKDVLDHSEVV